MPESSRWTEQLRVPSFGWALVVFVVSLAITLMAWAAAKSAAETQARSQVEFAAALDQQATIILLAGVLISLLVSVMIGMLALHREHALSAAARLAADMQRRERMEIQLRQSELKFRLLFADSPLPMWLFDRETLRFVDVNNAAITEYGYSHDDFLRMRITDISLPDDRSNLPIRSHTQDPILQSFAERRHRLRDGKSVEVETMAHDIELAGRPLTLVAINDITERKRAEEQLRQAQKLEAIGHLTGGVAHDFNNILTVITGTIEILSDAVADNPKLAAIAKMIDDAATRGSELTRDLLSYARRQPLRPRETDLNTLVRDVAKLLKPTLGEQIEIKLELDQDAWPASVDPSQLTTALINLALNARDAMPNGGRLMLKTGNVQLDTPEAPDEEVAPGDYAVLTVTDTGAGIAAHLLDQVFEPFFTTKEVGRGTGLGLSMVYGFVKQSAGQTKISSEEDRGTSVCLYLPRSSTPAVEVSETPVISMQGGRERILVVEDDPLVRGSVVNQLTSLGYHTLTADNGIAAVDMVAGGVAFDLLFTDVVMPGGKDGRQLAEEVLRQRPDVKVLYTSGYSDSAIVHGGRLDPDIALLNKPYRKAELARRIREVLDQTPAHTKPH